MKTANSILISVYSKEEENEQEIEEALKKLVPFDLEKEKIIVKKQTAVGFNEKKIKILQIILIKDRHTKAFLEKLGKNLGERQKEMLLRQKASRLDEQLHFYIRLDKEKLINGEYWITDSGNCFHMKISIAAFPAKREKALELIESLFK